MERINLIGLTGNAQVGKDTVADYIRQKYNYVPYAFATPIKEAARNIFDWGDDHLYGYLKEVVDPIFGVSPRQVFQSLGTDWGRDTIDRDIWLLRMELNLIKQDLTIITDIRFDNEAQFITDKGGVIINITRDNAKPVKEHVSEQGIDPDFIDYTIKNNGSLTELHNQIDIIMEKINGS